MPFSSPTEPRTRAALAVAGLPLAFFAAMLLLPLCLIGAISLAESDPSLSPPFRPWWSGDGGIGLKSYSLVLEEGIYARAWLDSLRIAATSAFLAVLLGYPLALAIARAPERLRLPLLALAVLPFWTSFLVRVYAWIGLLRHDGPINALLLALGLSEQPLPLLYGEFAIHLGIVYSYLPFAILPLAANLMALDSRLLDAAADLGARPMSAFLRVTLPLSAPGIAAAFLLVFVPALGEFVIPDLLGGPDNLMLGRLLWNEFFQARDWPLAAAITLMLLAMVVVPLLFLSRLLERLSPGGRG